MFSISSKIYIVTFQQKLSFISYVLSCKMHVFNFFQCCYEKIGYFCILQVWNIITGKTEKDFACHGGAVLSCAVSPDGSKFASTSADKTAKVGGFVYKTKHVCFCLA